MRDSTMEPGGKPARIGFLDVLGILSLWLVLLAGLAGVGVFGAFALIDWAALQATYAHFEQVARKSDRLADLFLAEAKQNIHRINLFAEGVWALLSAILAAIGLHGLCLWRKPKP